MIKTKHELTQYDNKEVFMSRPYVGWVRFLVSVLAPDHILFISLNTPGYDFELKGDQIDAYLHESVRRQPVLTSLENIARYEKQQTEDVVNTFKEAYADDKDAFLHYLIRHAYRNETDGEYGDPNTAQAIKEVAHHFFPEMDIT